MPFSAGGKPDNIEPWNKGLQSPYSAETLLKMSRPKGKEHSKRLSVLMKGRFSGEKNQFWKGGSTKYYIKQALLRDNYTCQRCGYCEPAIMQVDHIKPKALYPELLKVLENLMTLCPNCHARKSKDDKRLIYEVRKKNKNENN